MLCDINHSNILFDPPPRIRKIKIKINKWDLLNSKAFAQQRKPLKREKRKKRKPTEWEKIFPNNGTTRA